MKSDLTFLTNEDDRKLSSRLNDLLVKSERFDCLVGYFYLSGFYLIQKSLNPCENIRILIGLKTEREVYEALQKAKVQNTFEFSSQSETAERFNRDVLTQLESAEEKREVEEGIETFVRWCSEGKVEVRVYDRHPIHAKLYIFGFGDTQVDKGRVITGSSNLSNSGLLANLEFNVELKDRGDYEFAAEKFDNLWKDSVEVTEKFVETVNTRSHLAQFSPYELYLKFLYEYFQTELNQPRELEQQFQPEGFLRLQYQQDAVLTAKRILEEFNGVFIADVVGLGKTYMAAMLARELDGRCFVIAPPALLDPNNPGAWQNVFREFGVVGSDCESIGRIDAILKKDLRKYDYIIIDEAHRFRNEDTETYAKLHQICRNKKVILVTATPFNNRPGDLLSQLKLFQNSRKSTLPNLPNLENFFAKLNSRLASIKRLDEPEEFLAMMKDNAKEVRERILKYLMVRRTRNEISKFYGEDMSKQNLKFPEVEAPTPFFYRLSERENRIFINTIDRISKEIKYTRYRPLVEDYFLGELEENRTTAQNNLAKFMMILLVKRLESSFEAFRKTLERFIKSYEYFIKAFENGSVYVSKKRINQIFDLVASGDFDEVERMVKDDEAESFDSSLFKPEFRNDLDHDLEVLREIERDWSTIERDPKWEEFKTELTSDENLKTSKLLVFTESKETSEYLAHRIEKELKEKVICYTGSSSRKLREEVIENFDARAFKPKDDFRILITTDALAEGVSLHRSNVVINYDIPWNPTRMMQRVGRINRVDTKFESVHTYNFFPSDEGEDAIGLQKAAEAKIEAFIEMLGTDARLLTEGEEIKSFSLFDSLTSKEAFSGEGEEDGDSELKYLKIIRGIQQNDKELFAKIKALPRKARSARNTRKSGRELPANAVLTYFRLGKLDKFYLAEDRNRVTELDFLEAVSLLESDDKERQPIGGNFYELLDSNQSALVHFLQSEAEAVHAPSSGRDAGTKLRVHLRLFAKKKSEFQDFTDNEEVFWKAFLESSEEGAIAKKTVKNVWRKVEKVDTAREVLEILKGYFTIDDLIPDSTSDENDKVLKREVILSEHFFKH